MKKTHYIFKNNNMEIKSPLLLLLHQGKWTGTGGRVLWKCKTLGKMSVRALVKNPEESEGRSCSSFPWFPPTKQEFHWKVTRTFPSKELKSRNLAFAFPQKDQSHGKIKQINQAADLIKAGQSVAFCALHRRSIAPEISWAVPSKQNKTSPMHSGF